MPQSEHPKSGKRRKPNFWWFGFRHFRFLNVWALTKSNEFGSGFYVVNRTKNVPKLNVFGFQTFKNIQKRNFGSDIFISYSIWKCLNQCSKSKNEYIKETIESWSKKKIGAKKIVYRVVKSFLQQIKKFKFFIS